MNRTAELFHKVIAETPEALKVELDLSFAVAARIAALLEEKAISQKELARRTHTSEAAVSRWLSGTHNFTLASIGKIAAALGEPIVCVPRAEL